jgi:hypothetical protein
MRLPFDYYPFFYLFIIIEYFIILLIVQSPLIFIDSFQSFSHISGFLSINIK